MKKLLLLPLLGIATYSYATEHMETTIVTATRTEQSINKSLAPSSVIDREDIERLQATDIFDLLRHIPGISFSQNGGLGSNTGLFIRGTNSNHTLVLVNGQRMGSATLGTAAIQHISPELIEKVEIIKGPRASLYGADAVGGVINIITTSESQENKGLVKVSHGSNETSEAVLGIDYTAGNNDSSWGKINIEAAASYLEMNGFNRTENSQGANADDDEYDNLGNNLTIEYSKDNTFVSGINYIHNEGDNNYDNSCFSGECKPFTEFEIETSTLYAKINPVQMLTINTALSRSIDKSENSDHLLQSGDNYFETKRDSLSLQVDINTASNQKLTVGGDYRKDKINTLDSYNDANGQFIDSLDNKAFYTQYQADFKILSFTTSLREDDNEAYGKNSTGNFAIGIPILSHHKVILSYGTAFKAPTFNDLYSPFGGNPNLKPEKSKNYELGLRGSYDMFNWDINIFKNEITELIQWQPVDPDNPYSVWSPYNVNDVDIKGAELAVDVNINDWMLTTSYAYIETEDQSTGLQLLRRPKESLSVSIDKTLGDFTLGTDIVAYSSRFDDVDNTVEYGGYSTTDLRFGYSPFEIVKFQLKVSNLFDKEYTLASGYAGKYATEGRTGLFSVIFTPRF